MTQPIQLVFKSKKGLDEKSFVTFRLGNRYAKQLKPLDSVSIVYAGKELKQMRVVHVMSGPANELLELSATWSHVELELKRQQGDQYDSTQAPARRFLSLRRLYGPHRFSEDSPLTGLLLAE